MLKKRTTNDSNVKICFQLIELQWNTSIKLRSCPTWFTKRLEFYEYICATKQMQQSSSLFLARFLLLLLASRPKMSMNVVFSKWLKNLSRVLLSQFGGGETSYAHNSSVTCNRGNRSEGNCYYIFIGNSVTLCTRNRSNAVIQLWCVCEMLQAMQSYDWFKFTQKCVMLILGITRIILFIIIAKKSKCKSWSKVEAILSSSQVSKY